MVENPTKSLTKEQKEEVIKLFNNFLSSSEQKNLGPQGQIINSIKNDDTEDNINKPKAQAQAESKVNEEMMALFLGLVIGAIVFGVSGGSLSALSSLGVVSDAMQIGKVIFGEEDQSKYSDKDIGKGLFAKALFDFVKDGKDLFNYLAKEGNEQFSKFINAYKDSLKNMDEVQKKEEIKELKDFVLTISDQNGKQHDQDFISKLDSVFKSLDEFLRSEKDSFKDFFKELNKDASLSGIVRKDNLASVSPGDIDKPGTSVSSVRANNVSVSAFHR